MSTHNTPGSGTPKEPRDQSCVATPLDYINPSNPDPGEPGDDGPANDPPADDCPDGDRFIDAIMALSGSLRDLRRDPAPKSKKIKV